VAVSGSVDETALSTVPPPRQAPPGRFTGRALSVLLGVAGLAFAADIVAKQLVVAKLTGHAPVRVLGGLVYLDLTRNGGAAFSFGTSITFLFPLVAIVVLVWIGWMATKLRSAPWAVALGLVLGGALGNLVDRLFRAPGFMVGHVVDFISVFGPDARYFPIFNVADSALTCGIILAVLLEILGLHRDGTRVSARDGETGRRDDR
jgi:signal peptidase II